MAAPLSGKTALVTGATRGIGRAIAQRLLADGARVIATGTRQHGAGPEGASYLGADFLDQAATEAFVEEVARADIDIIVNNAGINRIKPFAEISPGDFADIQLVNVTVPFLLCRAVVPGMKARGWGRITNLCSIWGLISKAGRGSYSASKFALDGMTAALAAEVAGSGVLANCVSPGFIETDMTKKILGAEGMADVGRQIPAGRLGRPEEVAALVAWLSGPENTYISGQNIVIDGGFTRV